jgi:hypothetical protein
MVNSCGVEVERALCQGLCRFAVDEVIGSVVEYRWDADINGLVRGDRLVGPPNEGVARPVRIQLVLGRRPTFAGGNSAGDAQV